MIVCTTKVRDEFSEMGIDLKIKHSVSFPPTKYGGTFFINFLKLFMREQTLLDKFFGGCFTWELIIISYMGGN